jgi:hypothetical protein
VADCDNDMVLVDLGEFVSVNCKTWHIMVHAI